MTSAVPGLDMSALLGAPESSPVPKSAIEVALAKVDPADAAADKEHAADAKFQFRSLLDEEQLVALRQNAPAFAVRLTNNFNEIINFGEPVLRRLNDASVALLEQQREVKVPEADKLVNDLLRKIDGYEAKYSNPKLEGALASVRKALQGAFYSLKTMAREAQPIIKKIDMVEVDLQDMEQKLADNVLAGQKLHKASVENLQGTVGVLAALEEILDVLRADFTEVDTLLQDAESRAGSEQLASVQYKGKTISLSELRERHTELGNTVNEIEKSWFDWRQQFFLGSNATPTIWNLILVSATMQRQCHVFRLQGLPQARRALAAWQMAAVAEKGAEMGDAVRDGLNQLVQKGSTATTQAVEHVAMSSQTPMISEETAFKLLADVKAQCNALVAADRWGRAQREKGVQIMQAGEEGMRQQVAESRRALVRGSIEAAYKAPDAVPEETVDILQKIGVAG
jgi:uncharacterized protein YaaN involved in tellurite resistance